ncbi:hypothetical protein GCM10027408_00870 [Microbacterium tumbae]
MGDSPLRAEEPMPSASDPVTGLPSPMAWDISTGTGRYQHRGPMHNSRRSAAADTCALSSGGRSSAGKGSEDQGLPSAGGEASAMRWARFPWERWAGSASMTGCSI